MTEPKTHLIISFRAMHFPSATSKHFRADVHDWRMITLPFDPPIELNSGITADRHKGYCTYSLRVSSSATTNRCSTLKRQARNGSSLRQRIAKHRHNNSLWPSDECPRDEKTTLFCRFNLAMPSQIRP